MNADAVLVLLFTIATAVAVIARRLRIPYTVALVLTGLALGSVRALEAPHLTKELLFAVFLPGLIFEAAYHLDSREFWRNRRAITALAVPGVAVSIALTSLLLAPLLGALGIAPGIAWRDTLAFAALISATDPIAVVALFKQLGAPKRLSLLVEGESLLNDGTAVVFFSLALAYVGGTTVSGPGLAGEFVTVVGAGALIGAAVGAGVSSVVHRIDDAMLEITLTTIAAYGSFVAAEQFHVSGVIATVVAGLWCGNIAARTGMSPTTRIAVEVFWEYVAFALNSLVFLLIGFEVRTGALLAAWPAIVAAFGVVLAGRVAVVALVGSALGPTRERIPRGWLPVLTWGGLRGGLSMVLALGLPTAFPFRDLIVTMTFGVVVLSILGQGLTMAPLLRRLGVVKERGASTTRYERARADLGMAEAALAEVDRLTRTRLLAPDAADLVRQAYAARARDAESVVEALHDAGDELRASEAHRAFRHLLLMEKDRLLESLRAGLIDAEIYESLGAAVDARLLELDSGSGDGRGGSTDDTGGSDAAAARTDASTTTTTT